MKQIKSLSIYGFTIFFNAAISFVTFSLVTHHLTEVDYGVINLYSSSVSFLAPFIAVGVQFILGVDFFKMDEGSFRQHFTNALAIPVAACVGFTLLVLLAHLQVEAFLHINFFFALLIPFACLLTIYNDVILTLIRDKGKHRLFSIYSILKNVTEIGLTILLVVVLGLNWQGRLGSSLAASVLMCGAAFFLVKRWSLYTGILNRSVVKKNFITGLPFVPERLAIFVLVYSDRFFINYYKGTGDVGLYSAGAQIALIVNLGILTLGNFFYPVIYKTLSQPAVDYAKIRRIVFAYIGISAFIAVAVMAATPLFFTYFIGPRFQQGKQYAVFLTTGLFFWAVYNVFLVFLLNIKKNRLIMFLSVFGMILSVVLNFFLVQAFGALGATYTSIAVYFFMAACTVFFVHKFYGLKKIFVATAPKS